MNAHRTFNLPPAILHEAYELCGRCGQVLTPGDATVGFTRLRYQPPFLTIWPRGHRLERGWPEWMLYAHARCPDNQIEPVPIPERIQSELRLLKFAALDTPKADSSTEEWDKYVTLCVEPEQPTQRSKRVRKILMPVELDSLSDKFERLRENTGSTRTVSFEFTDDAAEGKMVVGSILTENYVEDRAIEELSTPCYVLEPCVWPLARFAPTLYTVNAFLFRFLPCTCRLPDCPRRIKSLPVVPAVPAPRNIGYVGLSAETPQSVLMRYGLVWKDAKGRPQRRKIDDDLREDIEKEELRLDYATLGAPCRQAFTLHKPAKTREQLRGKELLPEARAVPSEFAWADTFGRLSWRTVYSFVRERGRSFKVNGQRHTPERMSEEERYTLELQTYPIVPAEPVVPVTPLQAKAPIAPRSARTTQYYGHQQPSCRVDASQQWFQPHVLHAKASIRVFSCTSWGFSYDGTTIGLPRISQRAYLEAHSRTEQKFWKRHRIQTKPLPTFHLMRGECGKPLWGVKVGHMTDARMEERLQRVEMVPGLVHHIRDFTARQNALCTHWAWKNPRYGRDESRLSRLDAPFPYVPPPTPPRVGGEYEYSYIHQAIWRHGSCGCDLCLRAHNARLHVSLTAEDRAEIAANRRALAGPNFCRQVSTIVGKVVSPTTGVTRLGDKPERVTAVQSSGIQQPYQHESKFSSPPICRP